MAAEILTTWATQVRGLRAMALESARQAAPLIEVALRATASAGTTPDGVAWPAKKDGGRPLVNAAKAITAAPLGGTVVVTLQGVEVIHHYGTSRAPKRTIIPERGGGVPKVVAAAALAGSQLAFAKLTRGGS